MTSDRDENASLRPCFVWEVYWVEASTLSQFSFSRFEMSDDGNSSDSCHWSPIDDENAPVNVIRPYQFEPEFSSSKEGVEKEELEEEHQHNDENSRTRNLDW